MNSSKIKAITDDQPWHLAAKRKHFWKSFLLSLVVVEVILLAFISSEKKKNAWNGVRATRKVVLVESCKSCSSWRLSWWGGGVGTWEQEKHILFLQNEREKLKQTLDGLHLWMIFFARIFVIVKNKNTSISNCEIQPQYLSWFVKSRTISILDNLNHVEIKNAAQKCFEFFTHFLSIFFHFQNWELQDCEKLRMTLFVNK